MNKTYFLLPMMLLAGCYMNNDFNNTPGEERETLFSSSDETPVFVSDDPVMMPQQIAIPTRPAESVQPVIPQPSRPTLSADGTMIELPAQQIYIGAQAPAPMPAPVRQPNPYAAYPIAYSTPNMAQQPVQTTVVPDVVILQYTAYPNTFVQCPATDTRCIAAYEQQGFVQLQNKPRFAGYRDVALPSDYPAGKWRTNNNIPRW